MCDTGNYQELLWNVIPQCIFQDDKIDIFITLLPMSLFCYFWNLQQQQQQQQRKVMMLIRSRNYFKYIINARCSIRYNIFYLFYRWSSTQSSSFAVFVLYVCLPPLRSRQFWREHHTFQSRLHSSAFTEFAPLHSQLWTQLKNAGGVWWSAEKNFDKGTQGTIQKGR